MGEVRDECGIAAVYHLESDIEGPLCPAGGQMQASRLVPRMLLDIQNRGQLAAGMTSYNPARNQLIDTYKDVGTVAEVFRLARADQRESLMSEYDGRAAIGHVRYATCGRDDRSYAQPFERHHLLKHKWFSFAFNGQLANYGELREKLLKDNDHHLARETDTEIIMHEISSELSQGRPRMIDVLRHVARRFDGAYSLVFLSALGEMVVARDPLGIKPLCYAIDGPLFAAASESVALVNLGFDSEQIRPVNPGEAIIVNKDRISIERFAESHHSAHCFFEWVYFANVASTLDDRSVYLARTALGEALARVEVESPLLTIDDDTIVVPVPDTSKAAADAMAYKLGIPCREGLIRNRYSGRTFIEGSKHREQAVQTKYTPLREVLEGKRVLLVEDSIVRSTTMKGLLDRIRRVGGASEVHVRVACPPIIAPCFYGIDMSTVGELFAPRFMKHSREITPAIEQEMASSLGADSLRYLPVQAVAKSIGLRRVDLCQACITGDYPTECGQMLYQVALQTSDGQANGRTYEQQAVVRG